MTSGPDPWGLDPLGMGLDPLGMGLDPLGMGLDPLGMGVDPLGMGGWVCMLPLNCGFRHCQSPGCRAVPKP